MFFLITVQVIPTKMDVDNAISVLVPLNFHHSIMLYSTEKWSGGKGRYFALLGGILTFYLRVFGIKCFFFICLKLKNLWYNIKSTKLSVKKETY